MVERAIESGLAAAEISRLQGEYGFNELPPPPPPSPLRAFLRQFTGPLVLILVLAAVAAALLGEIVDTVVILGVVLLNGILGFVQEWRAERALAALRAMLSPTAMVRRSGEDQVIPARDIVPGDLLVLATGARIVADAALVSATDLEIDESVMTGESLPVAKSIEQAVFSGTTVVSGRGHARVTHIGAKTRFGEISALTGSVDEGETVLQAQFRRLAGQLGLAALIIAAGVAGLGVLAGQDAFQMILTGVSLAVAIVPEGLPAVVTITLALGAAAMVRHNALARRLQAVETLGAASVICTDKTGTLTENKMTAVSVWTPQARYDVTGTGYDPDGQIVSRKGPVTPATEPALADVLRVCALCTHASIVQGDAGWSVVGAPTEGALVTLAMKGYGTLPKRPIQQEFAFTSERKRMSVVVEDAGNRWLLMKGAPEQVLDACTVADPSEIIKAYEHMASQGLRVIALAHRTLDGPALEDGLTFLGLVGLIDPPRPEVRQAVADAKRAGIRVIMITGDSAVTARAIAASLGIEAQAILTGDDLAGLSDGDLAHRVQSDVLFARTRPADKLRIVAALQTHGQVVAMTGDGVNDAPALKQADIGVSMGQRGTDVAKEAADMVLLDDNFTTIVRAIGEGRLQFENIKKFVRYLLSSNTGEVVALVANIAIGGPLIFLPTQILWMNLVTDGVTAVALGLEKAEAGLMDRPPRNKTEPVIGRPGALTIILFGAYTGTASLWIFYHFLPIDPALANTAAFTAMVVFEKISVFAFRSMRSPLARVGWFSNRVLILALLAMLGLQLLAVYAPPLQALLHTVPLAWEHWQPILLFSLPLIVVPEFWKRLRAKSQPAA